MYERFFGLERAPFRITPDPQMFFPGANRGAVLEALLYAITAGEGIVKVVGEVGSGKTMLCRMLEAALPPSVDVVYLAVPTLAPHEILAAIASELGLDPPRDGERLQLLHLLQTALVERHAEGRQVVVFVEEAQGMQMPTLEEVRLLSNLETAHHKLLQIVLFGQPELDRTLARYEMRQLRDRITHHFELRPLTRSEVRDYLDARLRAAGHRGAPLFSAGAARAIRHHSGGLLRRVNVLADRALLAAYAAGDGRVTRRHVRRAVRDDGRRATMRPVLAGGLALTLAAAGAVAWWLRPGALEERTGAVRAPAAWPAAASPPALPAGVPPLIEQRLVTLERLSALARRHHQPAGGGTPAHGEPRTAAYNGDTDVADARNGGETSAAQSVDDGGTP